MFYWVTIVAEPAGCERPIARGVNAPFGSGDREAVGGMIW